MTALDVSNQNILLDKIQYQTGEKVTHKNPITSLQDGGNLQFTLSDNGIYDERDNQWIWEGLTGDKNLTSMFTQSIQIGRVPTTFSGIVILPVEMIQVGVPTVPNILVDPIIPKPIEPKPEQPEINVPIEPKPEQPEINVPTEPKPEQPEINVPTEPELKQPSQSETGNSVIHSGNVSTNSQSNRVAGTPLQIATNVTNKQPTISEPPVEEEALIEQETNVEEAQKPEFDAQEEIQKSEYGEEESNEFVHWIILATILGYSGYSILAIRKNKRRIDDLKEK